MDLDHLRKLAGIGEQNQMKSLGQEMSERRRAIMQNVMKEQKEEQLELQSLPYKITDLAPVLSKENVDYHYDILLLYHWYLVDGLFYPPHEIRL